VLTGGFDECGVEGGDVGVEFCFGGEVGHVFGAVG
jgi:hypothetical protein